LKGLNLDNSMNWIWLGLVVLSVVAAAFNGTMEAVTQASVDSAKSAVSLALGLVGVMAFWLGLMQIVQDGGLLHSLARLLRPVMLRLFPDVPADHPAMSAMLMNMASNMLGLGNAATPFGIKAMQELDRLNPQPGVATNAMALFLAINTSNVALAPLAIRHFLARRDVIPPVRAMINRVQEQSLMHWVGGKVRLGE
jgi:spore maturation protein SpmA